VDKRAALYQQFDPTRPLEAEEEDLYVDWQRELKLDDVKLRLANAIALSGPIPVCRLFTGHRGVGKTTELKRVKRILETGQVNRKLFVCFLEAEQWLDLNDVAAPDVVFHIARQIVDDLGAAGMGFAREKLAGFFGEIGELLKTEVELKDIKVPTGIADFGVVLKDVPRARATLRRLLEGRLPHIYDLINQEILDGAREWLRKPEHGGFDDVLVIVDQLDRIPQKIIRDHLTNQENIFLDHAGVLKFLKCDVLYTIPIELAYSRTRDRLKLAYSSEILTLPVIPVWQRNHQPHAAGVVMLCRIVEERAKKAGAGLGELFENQALLRRLCEVSGGHVRNLFILLRSAIERCDRLPITNEAVERTVKRQAWDISRTLGPAEWKALRGVHETSTAFDGDPSLWYDLLRNLFVFEYEDADGPWYDWNPLLGEVQGA
jgi:hypothetical protein